MRADAIPQGAASAPPRPASQSFTRLRVKDSENLFSGEFTSPENTTTRATGRETGGIGRAVPPAAARPSRI